MDVFADIAKSGIKGRLDELIIPNPMPFDEKLVNLVPCENKNGVKTATKISTKDELQIVLHEQRKQYAPFLESHAPTAEITREITYLDSFDYWTEENPNKIKVDIPHYGEPLGCATVFYETIFDVPNLEENKKVFVTFKGADYKAKVFVNNRFVNSHEGFFATFSFDITKYIKPGENTLHVELDNDYIMLGNPSEKSDVSLFGDKIYAATGPGYDDSERGWHHCPPGMGLFDKVFIEVKDAIFINDVFTRTLDDEIEVWAEIYNSNYEYEEISLSFSCYGENISQTVFEDRKVEFFTGKKIGLGDTFTEVLSKRDNTLNKDLPLYAAKGKNRYKFTFPSSALKEWNINSPYMYQLQITVYDKNGNKRDCLTSNFGKRLFTQDVTSETKGMFYLNGKEIRLRGANTMGFEQQDVMRGDFEQLVDDILLAKICNMNFLRLTQRPVQQEIYDYCDKLGLLIQTDLPLFGCLRRQQFCEAVRQAQEMERHVRKHPCVVVVSYINEPFPNAHNLPNMNLERNELEDFFSAADIVVLLENPDRVIKHVDGDYDPPSKRMPDNHCYPMWYNSHGIDIGKLNKGFWMPVAPNWYYGCGEFGCEGLEDIQTMMKYYPKEWVEKDADQNWSSDKIIRAQTNNFYHYFYPKQDTMEQWVYESQKFQALATRMMTEAFRRDNRMVTFAIHLFIDAFPSGWMKTIMDCDRNPKPAYFAYKNALEPLMISLRTDKSTYSSGEDMKVEAYICNDTELKHLDVKVMFELYLNDEMIFTGENITNIESNISAYCSTAFVNMPHCDSRQNLTLRAIVLKDENVLTTNDIELTLMPKQEVDISQFNVKDISDITCEDIDEAKNGKILFVNIDENMTYTVDDTEVYAKDSAMSPMHFAALNPEHAWTKTFEPCDFRMWYDKQADMITPISNGTFIAEGYNTVLLSRNLDENGTLIEQSIMAEKNIEKGKIVLSKINFDRMHDNVFGQMLLNQMK